MNNDDSSFGGKMLKDTSIRETEEYVKKYDKDGNLIKTITKHSLDSVGLVIYTALIVLIPLSIAVVGIVVCIKRKYL